MQNVRVAADRWNFELSGSGEPIIPLGGNMLGDLHPVAGTLFDRFDAADCDRRFGLMADLGLNCLRQAIGVNRVFDPVTGFKADGLRNWDTFIGLAEKHGIRLMPVGGYVGGNDWFDAGRLADFGRALDDSCRFWNAFASHYRNHPAIFAWDLRNELLFSVHPLDRQDAAAQPRIEAALKQAWPQWLESRYGSVAAMNRFYASSFDSFAAVPGSVLFADKPFDPCACDFRNYLNDRGYEWCKRQCEVLRSVSPEHMLVQGNNGWLFPDMDLWLANGFHNRALHDLFDFVTIHVYPAPQCQPGGHGDPLDGGEALHFFLNAAVAMARMDHYGKPVVFQEFGWYGGGASRFLGELPYRSETEHADYMRLLMETVTPHVNGFLNWPTFDMPTANDISNHGGIFTHDGRPKALTRVFADLATRFGGRRLVRARGTVTLTCSLLGLYTSRQYQDRLWEDVHAVVAAGQIPDFRFV
ncbi:MAG: Beta-galactosidase [Lentisphaerae bacterium ADurb.BinA184]|nr:MAG: Beta-galactosidase [Lentisphaerae bacterium ADurb.BinA184]